MIQKNIDQKLIDLCSEIVDLYRSADSYSKKKLISKSKEFFETLMYKFLGKQVSCTDFPKYKKMFYESFDKLIIGHNDILHNEITLAIDRLNSYSVGAQVCDFAIAHNTMCVDWVVHNLLQIKDRSSFSRDYSQYLTSSDRFFNREECEKHSGKKRSFYRNAYRAEMYNHRIFSDADRDGWCDMYTPIILTRMAMEQYIKLLCSKYNLYDEKFNEESKFNLQVAIDKIYKANLIDKAMNNEMHCIRKRGNANTHSAEPAFLFANIHGIGLLVECYKRMGRH